MLSETPPIYRTTRGRPTGIISSPSLRNSAQRSGLKGFPMFNFRTFLSNNSPIFALGAAILGLVVMTVCIGVGISLPA